MRGLNAELRELAPYITSTAGMRDIPVRPLGAVQAKLFQCEDGSAVVAALGAHETTIFGNWTWKVVNNRRVHIGRWEQPETFPAFCDAGDLPKQRQEGLHGLIWMEPVELQEGEKIRQSVFLTKPVDNVTMHVVVDEKHSGLRYWQHPRVWHTLSIRGNDIPQRRWHAIEIDAKSADLCGRKTVGFYFDTDRLGAVYWGQTFHQDRHGKRRPWFDRGTFQYAQWPYDKQITFKLDGFISTDGPSRVKFEPRDVTVRQGRWSDRMGYLDTHVYGFDGPKPRRVHLAELTQVPQFGGCTSLGASARAVFGEKSSLHFGHGQSSGKVQPQVVQQDGLVVGGPGHAALADHRPRAGRQDDIDQFDPCQLVKHPSGFIA